METTAELEQQIQALVDDFLARLRAGEEVDAYDVLTAHPHLAGQLEERLNTALELHELAAGYPGANQAPPACAHELPARIGRYEIRCMLGRGASAVVYRAWDPKFTR